jgi:hypothetical protein
MTRGIRYGAVAAAFAVFAATLAAGCGGGENAATASPAKKGPVFRNPFLDGKPGEWARYRWEEGKEMTLTLEELNPVSHQVVVHEEYRDPDKDTLMGADNLYLGPNHFLFGFDSSGAVIQEVSFETIRVAGRDWPCIRVDLIGRAQGTFRTWYSDEVPVTGLVKQVKVKKDGSETVSTLLEDWSTRPENRGKDESGDGK